MKYSFYCFIFLGIIIASGNKPVIDNYESNMLDAIQKLNTSKTEIDFNKAAVQFYNIAKEQKTNWLPYYYAGLCKSLIVLQLQPKQVDFICDEAIFFINKADSLSPNNSEVLVLKSMNYSARLTVNSATRATKYNKLIYQTCEQALQSDKTNPRAYLQKAQHIYHTPITFGGGPKKALLLYEDALIKYKAFIPKNKLMPNWGKDIAEKMIVVCKSESKEKQTKSK